MEQLISLNRSDSRFLEHLNGTFSDSHRAIPTRSLNVNTKKEYVTFRIVPIDVIKKPGVLALWWKVLRLWTLSLSIGPLLLTYSYLRVQAVPVDNFLSVVTLLPIFLLHGGMNLLNDYYDHLKGIDRVGSIHAIQKGWVRAIDLYYWGFAFLALGALAGLFVLFKAPSGLFPLILISGVGILEFSSNRLGLKYTGFGELTVFLLTGPLLVFGYTMVVVGESVNLVHVVGFISGLLAVLTIHINNIGEIISHAQANVKNLATGFGFDRAKVILMMLSSSIILLWFLMLKSIPAGPSAYSVWMIGSAFLTWICLRAYQARSSMVSDLKEIVSYRFLIHWTIMILLIVSSFS